MFASKKTTRAARFARAAIGAAAIATFTPSIGAADHGEEGAGYGGQSMERNDAAAYVTREEFQELRQTVLGRIAKEDRATAWTPPHSFDVGTASGGRASDTDRG